MLKKVLHGVFGVILLSGFLVIVGTAGSADFGPVNPLENTIRAVVGVLLVAGGFFGLMVSGWKYIG